MRSCTSDPPYYLVSAYYAIIYLPKIIFDVGRFTSESYKFRIFLGIGMYKVFKYKHIAQISSWF